MALMISVSGIRGIFGSDLNPENIAQYTAAFAQWSGKGTIILGRDSRITGPVCERIVVGTLESMGCKVINLGMAPTPTVAMAVDKHKASGGIILTASHNPANWNALKLLDRNGEFLDAEDGNAVIETAQNRSYSYNSYDKLGVYEEDLHAVLSHIKEILALPYIHPNTIRKANLSVALDAVNGAGSEAIPELLRQLNVSSVNCLYCKPDGVFPHDPEPLPENLGDICQYLKDNNCDIGFITDPDADRLAVVDENGKLWGEEYTQAAAFDFMLSEVAGPCATNLSSSRVADDVAKSYGQVCHRSAVGEVNVVTAMKNKKAVIGGEGNGGVINPDLHYGRDALVGIAMILQHLANKKQKASKYRASLPDYAIRKQKINLQDTDAESMLSKAKEQFKEYNPDTTDGVKIDFDEGWVHLRPSNTEPILRVYSEGKTAAAAEELANNVIQKLQ